MKLSAGSFYACASRVSGLYRYMLSLDQQTASRNHILAMFSPPRLVAQNSRKGEDAGPAMIGKALDAAVTMGLLVQRDDWVGFNPNLPPSARSPVLNETELRNELARLILCPLPENPNADLAKLIAWILSRDLHDRAWDQHEINKCLLEVDSAGALMPLNDASYSWFYDWCRYLGFLTSYGKKFILPDPTPFLRGNIVALGGETSETPIPISTFIERLIQLCPVFEGGIYRNLVEDGVLAPTRIPTQLSGSTSLALFRLRDEGLIDLRSLDDGNVTLLMDGKNPVRYTHVVFSVPSNVRKDA